MRSDMWLRIPSLRLVPKGITQWASLPLMRRSQLQKKRSWSSCTPTTERLRTFCNFPVGPNHQWKRACSRLHPGTEQEGVCWEGTVAMWRPCDDIGRGGHHERFIDVRMVQNDMGSSGCTTGLPCSGCGLVATGCGCDQLVCAMARPTRLPKAANRTRTSTSIIEPTALNLPS